MVTIANALHGAEGKTSLDEVNIDAGLRRTLQDVMPVASAWRPYLDGKRSMNDAFTALVLAFK